MNDPESTNTSQQLIYQAALLIEEQKFAEAEAALRDAIGVASVAGRHVELVQAKGFLGELLLGLDRADEAIEQFEDILETVQMTDVDRDAIEGELRLAREVIARDRGLE